MRRGHSLPHLQACSPGWAGACSSRRRTRAYPCTPSSRTARARDRYVGEQRHGCWPLLACWATACSGRGGVEQRHHCIYIGSLHQMHEQWDRSPQDIRARGFRSYYTRGDDDSHTKVCTEYSHKSGNTMEQTVSIFIKYRSLSTIFRNMQIEGTGLALRFQNMQWPDFSSPNRTGQQDNSHSFELNRISSNWENYTVQNPWQPDFLNWLDMLYRTITSQGSMEYKQQKQKN